MWHHRAHGHAEIVADGLATAATVANPIGVVPSSSWCCDRPSENEDIYIGPLVELPRNVKPNVSQTRFHESTPRFVSRPTRRTSGKMATNRVPGLA